MSRRVAALVLAAVVGARGVSAAASAETERELGRHFLLAARSELPVVLGAYPITPASDILHELSKHKKFGVTTVQAEDEIAAIGVALGAAYGGALGITSTSGPGVALKGETISLAVALELPLVIIDVQRAGPSTGMPTKTEQADLNMALFGRHGEAPVAVIAPRSPADCFFAALEAARIALTYRTPVILLSDGYIANGSEPWLLPDVESLPDLHVSFATEPNGPSGEFLPYLRDPQTMARPWAIPGTPGLEHRIGGLEKADKTGDISYDPANHDFMVRTRAARIEAIEVPDLEVEDPDGDASVLVLGWGSTYGPIGAAVKRVRRSGGTIAQAHLRHLNPFPANLGAVLAYYAVVLGILWIAFFINGLRLEGLARLRMLLIAGGFLMLFVAIGLIPRILFGKPDTGTNKAIITTVEYLAIISAPLLLVGFSPPRWLSARYSPPAPA